MATMRKMMGYLRKSATALSTLIAVTTLSLWMLSRHTSGAVGYSVHVGDTFVAGTDLWFRRDGLSLERLDFQRSEFWTSPAGRQGTESVHFSARFQRDASGTAFFEANRGPQIFAWRLRGLEWQTWTSQHAYTSRHAGISYAWLLFASAALPVWTLVNSLTRRSIARRRIRRGLCGSCGYDLRGGHQRCPECGHDLAANRRLQPIPTETAALI